jgi:hypothetical protein
MQSAPSPTELALNKLVKGCQITMHSAVPLAHKNERLHIENQRLKRKQGKQRLFITKGGIRTGAEAQSLIDKERISRTEAEARNQGEVRQ